ncbi:MAG: DUF86 domain-containing protein [Deltaproteobacteria bacterium]|nr:DUF86 domain-containing protein [Deltaproteobacteria bacterium]
MYDKEISFHILEQVQRSVEIILSRFQPVKEVADFTDSPGGMEKFDSICMLLITIGENLKNLDKVTHGQLLSEYSEIEWKKVKGLRDIISHQYFDINADAIFDVCQTKLPELRLVIDKMLMDLQ